MDIVIAAGHLPFKWRGKDYRIIKCGIENDLPYAQVEPRESELEDILKERVKRDHGLIVYLGLHYICFSEDYHH